jgi:hypothetical protein
MSRGNGSSEFKFFGYASLPCHSCDHRDKVVPRSSNRDRIMHNVVFPLVALVADLWKSNLTLAMVIRASTNFLDFIRITQSFGQVFLCYPSDQR